MSMKKKFLALALAGAVAMPVVANASGLTHQVSGPDSQAQYGQVTINGTVQTKAGAAPDGQISVELPTAMGFTVDKDGNVINAGTYTVYNRGKSDVSLSVADFTESNNSTTGLTVYSKTSFGGGVNKKRNDVYLTLTSGKKTVDLGEVATTSATTKEQLLIETIPANSQASMTLNGQAGKDADTNGVDNTGAQEDFVVKFKVAKK